ncbi:hypothetical protein BCR41DRAFT_307977 [Lobosporangium transversale]|uniref:PHD-type domain-containing protein n=1 Tax=Lobosporangium transversale TaxID=64571 RepID=A0A1Y2GIY7_9FUNG|nr:hypothetical protein BCR41DRAFT_307977 [Lobosporangium transversale]ORZ12131.1 hypothetical protein BCR41DRAFT_307977 [Lobosporangium transversale]|eukprot:XP_021879996.1 hypothetical protein BCR41DRAFT_307977 [Lobosporangium transversale]
MVSSRVAREEPPAREAEKQIKTEEDEGLYCICREPYDPNRFMIACDGCDDWFHGDCVGVAEKDSEMVDKYYCKRCEGLLLNIYFLLYYVLFFPKLICPLSQLPLIFIFHACRERATRFS